VIVGVMTWELSLPGCSSLKEKRMVVRSLKDRIRPRFNVSIAETGFQDVVQRAEITVALVADGRGRADSTLDRIDAYIEKDGRALPVGVRRELF